MLLATALRVPQMRESLWLDELHTAWVVDGDLREIPARAAIGNQSPLYFLLPWLTTRLIGLNEAALRLPSLVAGLAVIVAIYALVWRMTASHAGALLAAWLAAIEPNFLYYSLEARPYAWVQLIGVLQVLAFWQLVGGDSVGDRPALRWRMALVALSIALFYLHYTAALLIAAEITYFALAQFFFRDAARYSTRQALGDFALFALCCLPALWHLQAIAGRREAWWKFVPHDPSPWSLLSIFTLGISIGLPLAAVVAMHAVRRTQTALAKDKLTVKPLIFGAVWLFVPLLAAYAATTLDVAPLWMRRYVIVSAAAPLVIAGVLCSAAPAKLLRLALALVVAAAAMWSHGPQRQWTRDGRWIARSTQDWRAAVAEIDRNVDTDNWPALVRSGLIEVEADKLAASDSLRAYALLPVASMYRVDRTQMPLAFSQPTRLATSDTQQLAQSSGFWLITPGNARTKDAALRGVHLSLAQQETSITVEAAQNFGGVWVVKVRMTKSQ